MHACTSVSEARVSGVRFSRGKDNMHESSQGRFLNYVISCYHACLPRDVWGDVRWKGPRFTSFTRARIENSQALDARNLWLIIHTCICYRPNDYFVPWTQNSCSLLHDLDPSNYIEPTFHLSISFVVSSVQCPVVVRYIDFHFLCAHERHGRLARRNSKSGWGDLVRFGLAYI